MSKDLEMTSQEFEYVYMRKLFKRLENECPQFFLGITHDGSGWWLTGSGIYVSDQEAEDMIVGMCIKALPCHWHDDLKGGFGIYRLGDDHQIKINPASPSLVNGLLMSVGLSHGHGW